MSDDKSTCCLCLRPVFRRGYCGPHYARLLKYGDATGGGRYLGKTKAFIERLLTETHSECIIWPFATSRGYAYSAWNGKYISVSRLLCRLKHGDPDDESMQAAHQCGNGSIGCVNPACLYWATPVQNSADKVRHGTKVTGELCGVSRLSNLDADAIRNDTRRGVVIAAEYGVSPSQVSRIRSGKSRKEN